MESRDRRWERKMVASSWLKRLLAWVIDMHISMVFLVLAYVGSNAAYDAFSSTVALLTSIALYVIWYAVGFYNRCILMGRRGNSFGRRLINANLVFEKTGKPIGVFNAFVRENSHFIDWFSLGIGFLMPLWDRKRQTVADKVMRTITVEGPVPNEPVVLAATPEGARERFGLSTA
ncbi:RDD family protein [Micromonospora sp. RHAY321]|uniref:RDD family protein n=2 Tax=unclassified Micromonospora TaxID=2617518 RepID=UPI0027E254EF|nr:RDD family protein [Micromonospora sp. RHAY321]